MRKLLLLSWNHFEICELQLNELDIPKSDGYFQVYWTPCFPEKWLASSRSMKKKMSLKIPLRTKDSILLQCIKCSFVVLSLVTLHCLTLPPLPHFHACTLTRLSELSFAALILIVASTQLLKAFTGEGCLSDCSAWQVRMLECSDLKTHWSHSGLKCYPGTG